MDVIRISVGSASALPVNAAVQRLGFSEGVHRCVLELRGSSVDDRLEGGVGRSRRLPVFAGRERRHLAKGVGSHGVASGWLEVRRDRFDLALRVGVPVKVVLMGYAVQVAECMLGHGLHQRRVSLDLCHIVVPKAPGFLERPLVLKLKVRLGLPEKVFRDGRRGRGLVAVDALGVAARGVAAYVAAAVRGARVHVGRQRRGRQGGRRQRRRQARPLGGCAGPRTICRVVRVRYGWGRGSRAKEGGRGYRGAFGRGIEGRQQFILRGRHGAH